MKFFGRYWSVITFTLLVLMFFRPVLVSGKLPIPSDTIIGLYHPFRDLYREQYPNGIPFKNFLITDPVRQQYPWRELSVTLLKRFELPLWNPYSFSGTPLLANMQSAPLYPLNVFFVVLPFQYAWAILVVLQPILAGVFLYLYLRHMGVHQLASVLGSFVFAFSGFSSAWLEWNTVLHVALWLPLVLLAKEHLLRKMTARWMLILIFAESAQLFAGHLQIYFYSLLLSNAYLLARIAQTSLRRKEQLLLSRGKRLLPFLFIGISIAVVTSIQWIPLVRFVLQSSRVVDQADWQQPGWFIPWQHLIQFIAPDFFGNPTTLNYWGVWNYAEFVGYVGVAPLLFALFALFFRHDKKTLFFGSIFFATLVFSLPTVFAKVPYMLKIPLLSTSQPTRLLFITDFSLVILSAFGLDYFMRVQKKRGMLFPIVFLAVVLAGLWLFVSMKGSFVSSENLLVAKRNLYLPIFLFALTTILFIFVFLLRKQNKQITLIIYIIIVGVTAFDLLRFATKFTPFTDKEYLFPQTKVLSFLKKQDGQFRIMTTDRRILPPNFSIIYRLQSVDGYDPLYLRRYAELIAASERGKPDISSPFGFNRIITPHNYESKIIDLLGVRYVLSVSELSSPKLTRVFQEGETRIYENRDALPRAFFVENVTHVNNKEEAIQMLFGDNVDLRKIAIIEEELFPGGTRWWEKKQSIGTLSIVSYSENKIVLETDNDGDGFLVLTDSFYPMWKVRIDSQDTSYSFSTNIYRTNYNFRGVVVPKGRQVVVFYATLL